MKLIQDGGIGEVHRIRAGMQRNIYPGLKPTEMAEWAEPGDWIGICGWDPRRSATFDPFRCIYNFRWFWDYSGGQMTNWGAHHLDIARWIVAAEAPGEVSGFGGRYALTDGGETPDVQEVTYQFGKVVVTWTASEIAAGQGLHARHLRHEGHADADARRLPGDARDVRQGEDAGDGAALGQRQRSQRGARAQLSRLRKVAASGRMRMSRRATGRP